MLGLFSYFIYWLLFVKSDTVVEDYVDPGNVHSVSISDEKQTVEDINEKAGQVGVDVEGVEFSLSSFDGELIFRLWADKAVKQGGRFELGQGTALFSMPNKNSLLLRLNNCEYSRATDTVELTGSITGQILDTGQIFTAEELDWYMGSEAVEAQRVVYIGPNIEVQGNSMSIDLKTGQLDFTGPVNAGV